ncbi:fumarylacetoacetate hydrolase family protein [Marisediminicola senii]|uniref:fumarylacetoacetate hydrolase family protein n=1 Tax=Marisediminicola senii TaxID=2711233 RepID=UPI0013EBA0B6|nr:fumarylacetoacetate hydrolase family protein [Marisediminicola senii]
MVRIVGYQAPNGVEIAARAPDGLIPLCAVDTFWTDPAGWVARAPDIAERMAAESVTLVPPVLPSARVLCLGLNYRAHAAEGSFGVPDYPLIFGRWTASLTVDGAPTTVPIDEDGLDWEAEIAAFVGAPLKNADADEARAAVVGYATFNDLSARRAQKLTAQWTLGKNADASGPIGDLVTADEVGDLRDGLRVTCRVNGEVMQDGNSRDMIFELGSVLALVSRTMTLNPGDILVTGTPEGVGYTQTPPVLLGPGDVVEVEVERLGILRTPVIADS